MHPPKTEMLNCDVKVHLCVEFILFENVVDMIAIFCSRNFHQKHICAYE